MSDQTTELSTQTLNHWITLNDIVHKHAENLLPYGGLVSKVEPLGSHIRVSWYEPRYGHYVGGEPLLVSTEEFLAGKIAPTEATPILNLPQLA